MILILEGPNKVGKTTIAKQIEQDFGFTYFRDRQFNKIKPELIEYVTYFMAISQLNLLKTLKENIIVDRFHATEWVYGNINRNYSNYKMWDIDRELAVMNAKLLYMTDSIENINERNGKDMSRYCKEFDYFFMLCKIDKLKANLNEKEKIYKWIKNSL